MIIWIIIVHIIIGVTIISFVDDVDTVYLGEEDGRN
jgi:hypothetical protein